MQVPVFLTRQVFVKSVLAGTISLSAMVTSATNAALFVQSGKLVGMGVSGVAAALASVGGISAVAVGASVATAGWVAVGGGAAVSTGVCVPQAEVIDTRKRKTTVKFFIIQTSFVLLNGEGRQFYYIHKSDEKITFQKIGSAIRNAV
jgi:hypothetical protein